MEYPFLTTTYTDKINSLYHIEVYSHPFLSRLRAYIIFPEDHWILKEDSLTDDLLTVCRKINGDELVFASSNKAGFLLAHTPCECVDVMTKTIDLLERMPRSQI